MARTVRDAAADERIAEDGESEHRSLIEGTEAAVIGR